MPLEIHPKLKARLIEALTVALQSMTLQHGRYLDRFPAMMGLRAAEEAFPDKGPLRDQLASFVDQENSFTEFVIDSISEDLQQRPFDQDPTPQSLSTVEQYKDPQSIAVRIVERFASLPQKYTISLELPSAFLMLMGDRTKIELSSHLRIVKTNPELSARYPPEVPTKLAGISQIAGMLSSVANPFMRPLATWDNDTLYLQIDVLGFIGPYGGTNPHKEALTSIRAFFGLGIVLRIFEMKSEFFSLAPSSYLRVHREEADGSFAFRGTLGIDDNVSRAFNALTLDTLAGWINSPSRQLQWSDAQFEKLRTVFAGKERAAPILLASQWYFDGHGPDPLLKYIQTMVVLEILLGDKAASDQTGLNVLLGNRCAYLIGTSHKERADVLARFSDIYAIRSQIVHRGKHRLSRKEQSLFQSLRWMCCRVIHREVELLQADKLLEAPI